MRTIRTLDDLHREEFNNKFYLILYFEFDYCKC